MSQRPDPAAGPTVYLETFGCQMNVLDSQLVRGALRGLGCRFTDDWKRADVVLYNTCSVREHAEQKVYSRIGEVGQHKRAGHRVVLGVIGCMAERDGMDLLRRYPQVDLLVGPGELDKVPMLVDNALKTPPAPARAPGSRTGPMVGGEGDGRSDSNPAMTPPRVALQGNTHRRSSTLASAEDRLELLDLSRSFDPDEHRGSAYVRITRGCNKFCTYCVVPMTRGAEVHRPPDSIVQEVRKLVDAGVVEVTLLGQTVNHYHYDHGASVTVGGVEQPQVGAVVHATRGSSPTTRTPADAPVASAASAARRVTTFADLLRRIHEEVPALHRLRFVTNFPRDFGDDILTVMRDSPRICRYLHLPVQSGSDRILRLMNRGYGVAEYRALIERVRAHLPEATLATDVICGFPTETEDDHRATADLLRWGRFKNSFIFKYSPRPGTAAIDRFTDDVPEETKKRRNNELLAVQAAISAQVHAAYVGRTVRVFVESLSHHAEKRRNAPANAAAPGSGQHITLGWQPHPAAEGRTVQLTGRTDGDLIVLFDGPEQLVGTITDVAIERSAPLTLFGTRAQNLVDAHRS